MPSTIKPNRAEVSRSFPVLGFTIRTGAPDAWFEVALASDPALFAPESKAKRTSANFFSSRGSGLLHAERGESVYLVDPTVLARMSSAERLYYALATYAQPDGQHPEIIRLPPEVAPPVFVSKSFATIARRLPGSADYGAGRATLDWGGDTVAPGAVEPLAPAQPAGGAQAAASTPTAQGLDAFYDDGYPPDFWLTHGQALEEGAASAEDDGPGIEGPIPDDAAAPATPAVQSLDAPQPEYPGASRFAPAHTGNYRARSSPRTIDEIVIHITDGGSRLSGTVGWFQNPEARVSAHYVIGQDGEVVQMVRHQDVAWHANSANGRSIGIEHVANTRGLVPTEAQYAASAALVQWLCGQFGLPIDRTHVLGHSEADPRTTHRGCPNAVWDWDGYMARFTVSGESAADAGVPDAPIDGSAISQGLALRPPSRAGAVAMGQQIDVHWDDVELVPQPTGMSCWAASAAMVVGWRDRVSIDPATIAHGAGRDPEFQGGLNPDNHDEFGAAWGLVPEGPVSYSVQGFADLLERNGPLWIGVAVPSGHAVVVTGVSGDGTPGGTVIRYHDPWPPGTGAADATKPWTTFMAEYENRITTDDAGNVNIQVLHANGRRPVTTAQAQSSESFDVNWPDVQLVHQPTDMSCWAAAASMVVGWRDRISIDPTEIAHGAGHWEQYTQGLYASEFPALRDGFRLEAEPLQSFTIDAFRRLLERKGPLWVAADVPGFHAIVVTGMYGDGNPDGTGTFVRIADPWDRDPGTPGQPGAYLNTHDSGSRYILTWRQFVEEYEGTQRHGDSWGDVRIQILHAAGNAGLFAGGVSTQALALATRAPVRTMALSPMAPAGVDRMRAEFVANAGSGAGRRNCITIMNAGLRQLYGDRLRNPDGSAKALSSTVQDTMAALVGYGLAQSPQRFEFQNASGALTRGTTRPDALMASVEAWLNAQAEANAMSAWYVFGLSILDGYHSVILALDFNGTGDPLTHVFWADQIYSGWDDVTGTLDARITSKTQGWWDPLPERRKPRTRVTVWPLSP